MKFSFSKRIRDKFPSKVEILLNWCGWVSAAFGLTFLFLSYNWFGLMKVLTIYVMEPLKIFLIGLFGMLFLGTILLVLCFWRDGPRAWIPLIVLVIAGLMAVPLSLWAVNRDFQGHMQDYMEILQLIDEGKYRGKPGDNISIDYHSDDEYRLYTENFLYRNDVTLLLDGDVKFSRHGIFAGGTYEFIYYHDVEEARQAVILYPKNLALWGEPHWVYWYGQDTSLNDDK